MTQDDRYRGLLTISVILNGILKEERMKLQGDISRGHKILRECQENYIAELELSHQALEETRQMVPVEN